MKYNLLKRGRHLLPRPSAEARELQIMRYELTDHAIRRWPQRTFNRRHLRPSRFWGEADITIVAQGNQSVLIDPLLTISGAHLLCCTTDFMMC